MRGRSRTWVAALGLSLLLSAAACAPASASVWEAESYPATISGTQVEGKHTFQTAANTLSCTTFDFQGTLSGSVSELALTGAPSGCSTAGIIVMNVAMNGCTFNFGSGKELGAALFAGSAQIVCPAGKEIVWTASTGNCTAKIPPQVFAGTVNLENMATAPKSVKLSTAASGIHYTLNPSSGCLNKPAPGTYENGVYSGTTTLTAANSGVGTGLTIK
jgi:hypothetical protein